MFMPCFLFVHIVITWTSCHIWIFSYLYLPRVPVCLSAASGSFAVLLWASVQQSGIRMLMAVVPGRTYAIHCCRNPWLFLNFAFYTKLCWIMFWLLSDGLSSGSLPGQNQFLLFSSSQWLFETWQGIGESHLLDPVCYCKDGMTDTLAQTLSGDGWKQVGFFELLDLKDVFVLKGEITLCICLLASDASQFAQMNVSVYHPLPSVLFVRCLMTCDYFVVLLMFFYIILF